MGYSNEIASDNRNHSFDCLITNMTAELHQAGLRMEDRKVVVAIGGYTGLGKGTLAKRLAESVGDLVVLPADSFILDRATKRRLGLTGDEENAVDFDLLGKTLSNLISNKPTQVRPYDHSVGIFHEPITVHPSRYIIVEGTASLYSPLLSFLNLSYFLYADKETLHEIAKRVYISERGYTDTDFERFWTLYRRNCDAFINPSMNNAKEVIQITIDRRYKSRLIKLCSE